MSLMFLIHTAFLSHLMNLVFGMGWIILDV